MSANSKRLVFNEEGDAEEAFPYENESTFNRNEARTMATEYTAQSLSVMEMADVIDRAHERDRLHDKKAIKKRKIKTRENADKSDGTCLQSPFE